MKRISILLASTSLLVVLGCEMKNPFARTSSPKAEPARSEPTNPASTENDDTDAQGRHMTVLLDDATSQPKKTIDGELLWGVPAVSASPTLRYTIDTETLGAFVKATLVIYPVVDGEIDRSRMWQYAGGQTLTPAATVQLDKFHYIGESIEQNLSGLPAGTYRFMLQVNGKSGWDRQYIETTIAPQE